MEHLRSSAFFDFHFFSRHFAILKNPLVVLPAPYILESCIKIKSGEIFIFTLLCGTLKGFKKALQVFIKLFEALQRSVKIKT